MEEFIGAYLAEISQYKLLTHAQEIELGKKIRNGDQKSRELMINSNLKLVLNIAKKYSKGDFETRICEGNYGLIRAVDNYDYELGFKFSTYATWWIKSAIFSYFDTIRTVRLPTNKIELKNQIIKTIEKYVIKNGQEPSIEYLTKKLKKSKEDIKYLLFAYDQNPSLNKPIGEDLEQLNFFSLEDNFIEMIEYKDLIEHYIDKIQMLNSDTNFCIDGKTRSILEQKLKGIPSYKIAENMEISRQEFRKRYEYGLKALRYSIEHNI